MIEKLFKNCAQNPSEKKYRKVKFETNAKIKAAFESGKSTTSNESAVQCFLTHGWVLEEGEMNERVLKLPEAVQQTFQDVREVTERKETLQKELQAAFRRRVAARSKAAGASSGGCFLPSTSVERKLFCSTGVETRFDKRRETDDVPRRSRAASPAPGIDKG